MYPAHGLKLILSSISLIIFTQSAQAASSWIEAEWVDVAEDWTVDSTYLGYSGTGYLSYKGGRSRNQENLMLFTIEVPESGLYRIEIRGRRDRGAGECPSDAPEDDCNDVFSRLNDGPWEKTMIKRAQYGDDDGGRGDWSNWFWDGRLADRDPSEPTYYMEAGIHNWAISGRSGGVSIDAFVIFPPGEPRPGPEAPSWLVGGPEPPSVVARHPEFQQTLIKPDGTPFFICGPGGDENFLYRGSRNPDGTRSGDQMEIINQLIEQGGNCLYMQVIKSHGGDGNDPFANPFVDGQPGSELDEDILDQWEDWFSLMDEHGILIYLILYDDGAVPFGKRDSVGIVEEAFIASIVNRFEHLQHLIWVVGEESNEQYTLSRVRGIAETIAAYDDFGHIIGDHRKQNWPSAHLDTVITHHSLQGNVATPMETHATALQERADAIAAGAEGDAYFVIYSENTARQYQGPESDEDILRMIWDVAMANVQVMVYGMFEKSGDPPTNQVLNYCRILSDFFEKTDYYRMEPADHLAEGDSLYVLANSSQSAIAYAREGSVGPGLKDLPSGQYDLHWVDVRTGEIAYQQNIPLEGNTAFPRPSSIGPECAVWVNRVDTAPSPGAIRFSHQSSRVSEDDGSLNLEVERVNGSAGQASVAWETRNGSATDSEDYSGSSGVLNWDSGEFGAKEITIVVINDDWPEPDEVFEIRLSEAEGAFLGTPFTHAVTIEGQILENQAPKAEDMQVNTETNTPVNLILSMTDPDSGPGPHTYTILSGPENGLLKGTDNDLIYRPTAGFSGTDSFTFQVHDGQDVSNTATVTIIVSPCEEGACTGTVNGRTPYQFWAGYSGLEAENSGYDRDPDQDGIPNLLEYFLLLNPLVADDQDKRPRGFVEDQALVLITRRNDASAGISLQVVTFSRPGESKKIWQPDEPGLTAETVSNNGSLSLVRYSVPADFNNGGFLALQIKADES